MQPAAAFPNPTPGASLILSFRLQRQCVLIIGSGTLAAARAFAALEADASVIILAHGGFDSACEELQYRAHNEQLSIHDLDGLPGSSKPSSSDEDVGSLQEYLRTLPHISLACITDTLSSLPSSQRRTYISALKLHSIFKSLYIPVNTTDYPDLCDYTFTSTHRFIDPETSGKTALQVGVTANGMGCRLAGRIRRDIVARLPREVGSAVDSIGRLRRLAKAENSAAVLDDDINGDCNGASTPNEPVPSWDDPESETVQERAKRRSRWVAQVSEYWPIEKLARMTQDEMEEVLSSGRREELVPTLSDSTNEEAVESLHSLTLSPDTHGKGKILLVGSGPGHPSLLTLATHRALTQHAQLVLSDKLVPAAVLAIIPKGVEVKIARKFPGNADGAQEEMMRDAVDAAKRGLTVVRVRALFYPSSNPGGTHEARLVHS
jgi:uroporphyrin-III C-methyltransferase